VQILASVVLTNDVTKTLEVLFEFQREFGDLWELETFGRIEIVNDVIRLVKMRRATMHLMQFDARQIRQPGQRSLFGCNDVILLLFTKRHMFDPFGVPSPGDSLLKKRLAADAVRITH